jgi:hypothetical protein
MDIAFSGIYHMPAVKGRDTYFPALVIENEQYKEETSWLK